MKISTFFLSAFFINAAFSVTQTVSDGWPVVHEVTNFADGMADDVGGLVHGGMDAGLRLEKEGYEGGGVAKPHAAAAAAAVAEHLASVQETSFDHSHVRMEDGNSSNVRTGRVVLVDPTDNKQAKKERKEEELRKEISDLLAQNLELKHLLASARQLDLDQNVGGAYDLQEDVLDAKRILSSDLERESRSSRRLSEKGHQVRSRSQNKSNKAAKDDKKKAKKSYHGSVSDDTNEDEDSESSDYEPSSGEESVCEEVAFKPTVEVITHATNVHPREDLFWTTWREGAESALNDTAYLEWNAVGYNATAATEALNKACSSSDAIVVTVPYASGTEDYEKMDDAINRCIFDHRKPVFTANTDTYHNNDVYAYFGSSNYDMGVKCALAVLFPDDIDIISGRKALPDKSNHSKDIRIYWDSVSKKDEGLRQRFEGLKTTFESFDKDVVKYLPSGRPSCPCVSQYKEGGPKNDEELRLTIDGEVYQYPPRYGLETCSRHDKNMIPSCSGSNPPAFCGKSWCYVDPDNCDSVEPSTEGEYVWTDYPGQMYPYSYETCGSKNLYNDFISGDNGEDVGDDGTGLIGENIQTIVLSSNWAPDFEADDNPESVFICGDETYSMPHVPQIGQSPFLQGLSSASAASAAARSVEKNTEWRAFKGNAAASSSSTSYNGPDNFASFAICLRDISNNNNPVSRARVQCWDNDNNGLGQSIGVEGLTLDDGCHTVHYDANSSWDWAYGNSKRPDIYCTVNYNGGSWRTPEKTNHDGTFFIQELLEEIPPPDEVTVCLESTSYNNEPVSGAHVQCWDNDNNGLGTPIGDKGMTGDDGCHTVTYDREQVGDPWQLFGTDPDIYCKVSYLGQEWETNRNEGVNLNQKQFTFSTLREATIFRSKIKESLSRHGKAIVNMFERYNVQVGDTWDVFGDAEFEDDWIIQHPPPEYLGKPSSELPVPELCTEGDADCNTDFGLKTCVTDDDCGGRKVCPGPGAELFGCAEDDKEEFFAKGICREVDATKRNANSSAQKLCVGHSDFLYDRMFNHIIQAEEFVDVTSLDSPGGGFIPMFRNAIQYLDSSGRNIVIKFMFASALFEDTKEILEGFLEGVNLSSRITIFVGTYRTSSLTDGNWISFNHGKVIAVDGKKVFTGGTNFYDADYLQFDPVHDINIRVSNGPAQGAHNFAARIWKPVCEWTFAGAGASLVEASSYVNGELAVITGEYITTGLWDCPPVFQPTRNPYEKTENGAMVIQSARLGPLASDEGDNGIEDGQKTSDFAMLAMMESAQNSIKVSAQDVLPMLFRGVVNGGFDCGYVGCSGMFQNMFDDNWRKIGGIAKALSRDVEIFMMVSAPCSFNTADPNGQSIESFQCPIDGTQGEGFDYWSLVLAANDGNWPAQRAMDQMYNHITKSQSPLGAGANRRRLLYGYGWNLHNIADWLFAYYAINKKHRPKRLDGSYKNEEEVVDHICRNVNIAHVRLTANEDTYMRNSVPGGQVGNHAKVLISDDEAFYIGSDNFYGANLQEFGLVVDDAARTNEFVDNYYTSLWTQARGTNGSGLVSGATSTCTWRAHYLKDLNWKFNK